ncbi:Bax inhibitor-1/YccA family protein [Algihabitans albus]|uniref:Bax inhibitor-1/YccA family protein n=1 Tax=Algihabitans albus TaxID=2164067 RepID=UPI000E5D399E|nr:Bax inhibitor-1/YccA family protein [Algihabitans albus]
MASPDRRYMTRNQAEVAQIDEGLRSYMLRVYNYMSLGVAFTGAIAMMVAMNPAMVQALSGGLFWVLFIGILGLGWFAPKVMMTKSVAAAQACFWAYAALWGALLGPMFYAYLAVDPMLIPQAFFITAGTFAGMSLLGYTTKKNLGPMGAFLAMATIGLLIAMLVNVFFLQSSGFELILSIGVVLVFSGLTAYETQMIKNMYYEADGAEVQTRKSIFGAFMLYGAFVVMFIHILNILAILRGD